MRKYEQVKDYEKISDMLEKEWPCTIKTTGMKCANGGKVVFYNPHTGKIAWYVDGSDELNINYLRALPVDRFFFHPPEITLEEARERIKSGVVYFKTLNDPKFYQVHNFLNDDIFFSTPGHRIAVSTSINFYPFDPTPFVDLLEKVEEEKETERPPVRLGSSNDYLSEHLERIYSELDALKESQFKILLGLDIFSKRIQALEGKNDL